MRGVYLVRNSILAAGFCWLGLGAAQAQPVKVVASFSILGDFVRQVGGDRVELTEIAGPGQDAHVYEPRPADVAAVSKADLVVVNGLHFEGFLDRLLKASAGKAPVVALSEGAALLKPDAGDAHADHDHAHDHDHDDEHEHSHNHHDHGDGYDPHAWQSAANAVVYVRNLVQALCKVDAQGCDQYRERAQAYTQQLQALDAELKAMLGALPESKRVVLTAHGAFRYFGHAYGLVFLSPTGVSTEAEATAADMRRLVEQLRQRDVAAIFLEQNANPRLVQRLAAEARMPVSGTLYADTLSAAGGPVPTYLDMMRHNARAIVEGIEHPR